MQFIGMINSMNQIPRPKPIDIVYLYTVKKCPFTLIAEKYGVSETTVRKWAKEMGIETRGIHDKGTRVDIHLVRVMIREGYSIREMAEKLGKSPSGIARVIKKYDLRSFKNGNSEV